MLVWEGRVGATYKIAKTTHQDVHHTYVAWQSDNTTYRQCLRGAAL